MLYFHPSRWPGPRRPEERNVELEVELEELLLEVASLIADGLISVRKKSTKTSTAVQKALVRVPIGSENKREKKPRERGETLINQEKARGEGCSGEERRVMG
jgi:hypothetical protein